MKTPKRLAALLSRQCSRKPSQGVVVAVGTGVRKDDGSVAPLDVKAKDKILFGKWSGNEVTIDGEELLIMKESDILGIIGCAAREGEYHGKRSNFWGGCPR